MSDTPLWQPSPERIAAAQITAFRQQAEEQSGRELPDYAALHRWSVEDRPAFWQLVWDFCGVIFHARADAVLEDDGLPGARWFPGARLNFAENLLRRRDDGVAVVFRNEAGARRSLTFGALYREVARAASSLRAAGIGPGDRVAGYLPNLPEALIASLASASVGAIWSSCSPDFGPAGLLDRFEQIEPRFLFAADGYVYGGKRYDTTARLSEILSALPSVEQCVVVPYLEEEPTPLPGTRDWNDWLGPEEGEPIAFESLPFDHPLTILYSSGTTGPPKCIVHSAGGTLLQHLKEHRLHVDLGREDRLFYFTTCGWMMWNWLVSAIASEAGVLLYDGSPSHPDPGALFRMADEESVTVFGTSAKFLDAVAKSGTEPRSECRWESVRTLLSTGSPLAPEGFDFVHAKIKADLHVASISGGTDIVSCFVLGDPASPVFRGEIQAAGLGMAVEVFDDAGSPVSNEPGELVCTAAFPSVPIGFWNDEGDHRFRAAYFERYPGVWHHGDWVRTTEHGGYVISGRSDAVLNPGGVRIGTSEIYRAVETLDEVVESIAVGQDWEDDVRVVLFVVLREGLTLDAALSKRICKQVREMASPRHVPARVLQVRDIPRTRSGKITELAVREVIHQRPVKNIEALANPQAIADFRDRPELSS